MCRPTDIALLSRPRWVDRNLLRHVLHACRRRHRRQLRIEQGSIPSNTSGGRIAGRRIWFRATPKTPKRLDWILRQESIAGSGGRHAPRWSHHKATTRSSPYTLPCGRSQDDEEHNHYHSGDLKIQVRNGRSSTNIGKSASRPRGGGRWYATVVTSNCEVCGIQDGGFPPF